jgi:hypothetical protein
MRSGPADMWHRLSESSNFLHTVYVVPRCGSPKPYLPQQQDTIPYAVKRSVLRSWRWAKDCPKHVELILEISKFLLLHLVGFFYITLPTLMMHGQTQIMNFPLQQFNYIYSFKLPFLITVESQSIVNTTIVFPHVPFTIVGPERSYIYITLFIPTFIIPWTIVLPQWLFVNHGPNAAFPAWIIKQKKLKQSIYYLCYLLFGL